MTASAAVAASILRCLAGSSIRAELLRDGGPELVAAMIDELRELHLGVPRPDPDAPPASNPLRATYETARRDQSSSEAAER